jgi:hypothetical protein
MTPDQVNTAGWDKGWTNLVNDVEQTFTPSLTKLVGVEVELLVGNAGAAEDHLTLTVLDATGRTVAVLTESVQTSRLRSGDVCDSSRRSGSYTGTDLPIEIERGDHVWVEVYRGRI